MDEAMEEKYRGKGMVVRAPAALRSLQVVDLGMGPVESYRAQSGDFVPFRGLANLALVEPERPNAPLEKFAQAIEIEATFTAEDVQKAAATGRPLALAYWDERGKKWVRFTESKHGLRFTPGRSAGGGGTATLRVSEWGDPPTAWGS